MPKGICCSCAKAPKCSTCKVEGRWMFGCSEYTPKPDEIVEKMVRETSLDP